MTKQIKAMWQDRRVKPTLILICLSALIWFFAPYIAIAGHSFLAKTEPRLITILILVALWGLNNLRLHKQQQHKQEAPANDPVLTLPPVTGFENEIAELEINFKHILQQQQTPKTSFFRPRPCKPGYLVIGPSKTGKTTLLNTFAHDTHAQPIASLAGCDWWLINNAVFLDCQKQASEHGLVLWQHLLKLFKKHRFKQPINGVLITVSLPQLYEMPRQEQQYVIQQLAKQLKDIKTYFPHISGYLIFTQSDLISGFTEFFENLDSKRRLQPFGFELPACNNLNSLTQAFEQEFNQLLKHLDQRLIWRLHQEHSIQRRAKIKDFLLQLETLKNSVLELIKQISSNGRFHIQGGYFTSSVQEGTPVDYLLAPLTAAFNIEHLHNILPSSSGNKPHFIMEFMNSMVERSNTMILSPSTRFRYFTFASAGLLTFLVSIVWYQSYNENMLILSKLKAALTNLDQNQATAVYPGLASLNALSNALNMTDHHMVHWFSTIGFSHSEHLTASAKESYQNLLAQRFLPQLNQILITQLAVLAEKNPSQLYGTLKTYLMLANPNRRDTQFIQQWFTNYWRQTFPGDKATQLQLQHHLANLLQNPNIRIPNESQVVVAARKQLSAIPLASLSFSVLLDHYQQTHVAITSNDNPVFIIADNYNVSALYTAANFNKIYQQEILEACKEVTNGNWVLGDKNVNANQTPSKELIRQVQTFYLTQYANAWQTLLSKIVWQTPTDLNQTDKILTALASKESPFWQLLNTIAINTAPNSEEPEFNEVVSRQFRTLQTFMANTAMTNQLQTSIEQLASSFHKIANAADPEKSAYMTAAIRMENEDRNDDALAILSQQAPNLPSPMQEWITNSTLNSWKILLANAQNYLNEIWEDKVFKVYRNQLANRYPLYNNATSDISLKDFSHFFGPDGIVDDFFNAYLKPFVDTRHFYWVWKSVDGAHIGIPQSTLDMFMRATLIQKMFFAYDTKQPLVKFTLAPEAIEPGVQQFSLDLDGQNVDYNTEKQAATDLVWPGPKSDSVSIQFVTNTGKKPTLRMHGPWAWFRLLSNSNLENTNNPKHFRVTFDLNGNSVKYDLYTAELINPFIPSIIDAFRLPDRL